MQRIAIATGLALACVAGRPTQGQNVIAWGDTACRNIDNLRNCRDIDSGISFSAAITSDGRIAVWGPDVEPQGGIPPSYPAPWRWTLCPDYVRDAVAVSVGSWHGMALTASGAVHCWGDNWWGECRRPDGLGPCVFIAAGDQSSIAIQATGVLRKWGAGAAPPATLGACIAAAAGTTDFAAITASGALAAWGTGTAAVAPPGVGACVEVACGGGTSIALRSNGTVVEWGTVVGVPPGLNDVVAIDASFRAAGGALYQSAFVALRAGGEFVRWGAGTSNSCAELPPDVRATKIAAASNGVLIVDSGGNLRGSNQNFIPPPSLLGVPRYVTGTWKPQNGNESKKFALSTSGHIEAWGDSWLTCSQGSQLEARALDSDLTGYRAVLQTGLIYGGNEIRRPNGERSLFRDLAMGYSHAAYIRDDGTVLCEGSNVSGQCNVPPSLGAVVDVACSPNSTIALRSDGTPVTWGGDGLIFPGAHSPARIVRAGGRFGTGARAIIVRNDGTIKHSAGSFSVPTDLTDVVDVAISPDQEYALFRDGRVRSWPNAMPLRASSAMKIDGRHGLTIVKRPCDRSVHLTSPELSTSSSTIADVFDYTFTNLPPAATAPELLVSASGAYALHPAGSADVSPTYFSVVVGNTLIYGPDYPAQPSGAGNFTLPGYGSCPEPRRSTLVVIPASVFNAARDATGGSVRIRIRRLYVGAPCLPFAGNLELSYDTAEADLDGDLVPNCMDNCVGHANADQADCNLNGVGDACEIASGLHADCDGDGFLDICEGAEAIDRQSPLLGPIGDGAPLEWVLEGLPPSSGTVAARLDLEATGDLGLETQFLRVEMDGVEWNHFVEGGSPCPDAPDIEDRVIEPRVFSALIADGAIRIRIVPSPDVDGAACRSSGVRVRLRYEHLADGADCNRNGLLDSCEFGQHPALDTDRDRRIDSCERALGDYDLDGAISGIDLVALINAWGMPNPDFGDLNNDGVVDSTDIAILIDRWGSI